VSTSPTPPADRDPEALVRQARELAAAAREAEERAEALRRLRDRAIIGLIEAGWSTRRVGRELGLTATQVSTVWRRSRPPRGTGPGRRAEPATGEG
jgi:DNA-binding NarL/FixJ family response regulator